jgi:glycosyltransferase involved in cell wall biosynthesis
MSHLRVSVVIPVYNGGEDLRKCMQAISESSYRAHECILVDDASTDGMADEVAEAHGARVIHLKKQSGPGVARNAGVNEATGDVIFFVDADVLLHPDSLAIAVRTLESEPDTAAVFGSYDDEPSHPSFFSQYRNLFHHWVHQTAGKEASTFWTGCGAIRREIFLAMGGFDTNYRRPSIEDIELGSRMYRSGYRIRLDKALLCKHMKQWKFWDLVSTDIFQRGIPWMVLLLHNRDAPSDLNLSNNSRIATVLAGLLVISLVALLLGGHAAAIIPPAVFLGASSACILFALKRNGSALPATFLAIALSLAAYVTAGDPLAIIPLILILLLVWTHLSFYRYVAKRRNSAFVIALIPMQVVFFLGCAISATFGILIFLLEAGQVKKDNSKE